MSMQALSSAILVLLSSYPTLCAAAIDGALPQAIAQPIPAIQLDQAVITIPETAMDSPQPEQDPEAADDPLQQEQAVQQQVISIPKSSAIAATFCSTIGFENQRKSSFPVTLFLARPVMDSNGEILAPVNSLVSAQLKPTSEGVQVQIDALVVGGQFVPVKTSAVSIPVLSTVKQDDTYAYGYEDQNRGVMFNVANGLQSWLGNQGILPGGTGDLLGAGLAVAAGVSQGSNKPKETKLMEIPEKSTLIFSLLSAIDLPAPAVQVVSSSASQTAVPVCSEDTGITQDSSDETTDEADDEATGESSDTEE